MATNKISRRNFLQTGTLAATATALAPAVPSFAQSATAPSQPQTDTSGTADASLLRVPIQTPDVVEFQIREYLMKRVPPLPQVKTAADWTREQRRLRKHLLEDIIFHGWPGEWVNAPPKFEDAGMIPTGKGYRLRKLRYEVVPDFYTTAVLYEPESPSGKAPATINLNGHAPNGKAAQYKQKRCINNALQGMYALSLEYLGMGENYIPENNHWAGSHLNLIGFGATGLFYLAIRRGLDYLCSHPNVDAKRIGVTGLSGGAWQSIIIASLDERVAAAVPIAGYFSFTSAIERNSDVGDMEYHPQDLHVEGDYSTLTAMVAPRPMLLIYGATDEYGLRAPMQKPHLYDDVKPYYDLYGKGENLVFYENVVPGTHNYEQDNREQSYQFFTKHFGLPIARAEIPVDQEVKTQEQLVVGMPAGNLTIIDLARKLATGIKRPAVPTAVAAKSQFRQRLKEVVRYKPATVKHAWPVYSTRRASVAALAHRLEFENGLSANAVWLRPITGAISGRATLLLDDDGMKTIPTALLSDVGSQPEPKLPDDHPVWSRLREGDQVIALNVVFTGDASPDHPKNEPVFVPPVYKELFTKPTQMKGVINWLETRPPSALYGLLLSAAGDRPLGMQAAQLLGTRNWLRAEHFSGDVGIEAIGMRSQVTALVAAALEPMQFTSLSVRDGRNSLGYLLEKFIRYQEAPDLFCLDLFKYFDIDSLSALAEPTKVKQSFA